MITNDFDVFVLFRIERPTRFTTTQELPFVWLTRTTKSRCSRDSTRTDDIEVVLLRIRPLERQSCKSQPPTATTTLNSQRFHIGRTMLSCRTSKYSFQSCHQVSYRLKQTYDWEQFTIHRETGLISSNHIFDREVRSDYYVIVIAEDGAPSDRPNHFPRNTPNRG